MGKKIKVLQIVEALGGGVYSYFTDLSHVMGKDQRLEVIIAYSNKRQEINPDDVTKDFHPNCKLVLLDLEKEINPFKDIKGLLEIKKKIRQITPDIVHLHSSKAGILGRLALLSFPKVTSFYTPHGYAFLRKDISKGKQRLFRFLEKNFAKHTKTITVACGDTELDYAQQFEDDPLLVRNGVDVHAISSSFEKKKNTGPIIGIVGRITYARHPELFNDIATAMPTVTFRWIGDGELREKITASNIEVTGWFTNRTKALEEMSKIDIYLQTSLWEGLPIALLEAMSIKLPIVATNIVGNKDVVLHNETGYLFDGTKEAITYLNNLLNDFKRKQMGDASFDRVSELFDARNNFKSLADLYISFHANKC